MSLLISVTLALVVGRASSVWGGGSVARELSEAAALMAKFRSSGAAHAAEKAVEQGSPGRSGHCSDKGAPALTSSRSRFPCI